MTIDVIEGGTGGTGGTSVAGTGLPKGNTVMFTGNSINATGHHLDGTAEPGHMTDAAIMAHTILASGGKLCASAANHLDPAVAPPDDAAAATSNLTAMEIRDAHFATIFANEPAIAVLGPGIVENGGPDAEEVGIGREVARDFVEGVQAYGGLPVLVSAGPSGVDAIATSRTYIPAWNTWLRRYAQSVGAVYVDSYGDLVDPTTDGKYKTGLSTDGLHLTKAGGKVVGEKIAATLEPILAQIPSVPLAQAGEQQLLMNGNPLFTTDPTNWTTSATGTSTVTEDAEVGKWFELTASTSGYTRSSPAMTASDGDRLLLSFRVRLDAVDGGTAKFVFRPQSGDDDAGLSFGSDIAGVTEGVYAVEWTHTNAGGTQNKLHAIAFGVGTKIAVSQVTLINLTANAILPV